MKLTAGESQLVLMVYVDVVFAAPQVELAEVRFPRGDFVLDGLGDLWVDVYFVPDVQQVRLNRRIKFPAWFGGQLFRYFLDGERVVDASLPFVAKGKDAFRVLEVRVSLAAIEGADSGLLAVPPDQVVNEPEADSALGSDVVGAALCFSLLDETDRGELGQTHPVRGAAAFDVGNERLDAIVRDRLMTPGRGIPRAEVTAEDVLESRFLIN